MTENRPKIEQDGRVLHGDEWVAPEQYIDDDVASGHLVSLKGSTPLEWPTREPATIE